MNSTRRIDAEQVKSAADGRWPVILRALAPELVPALDAGPSKKVCCPLPYHDDGDPSFRIDRPDEGRAICSCGGYDGWNLLELIRRWDFPECLRQVAGVLHLDGANGNDKPKPATKASQEGSPPAADPLIRMAETKRCPVESLRAYGGVSFPERGACAFPMFDASGAKCSQFNLWPDSRNDLERKGLNVKNKPTGVFLPLNEAGDGPRMPKAGETWGMFEGPKDTGRAHSLGYLAVGLPGKSIKPEWVEMFRGVDVLVCLDNDKAGKEAAPKVAKKLQGVAATVHVVKLPHPGDLRDNLALDGGEQMVRDAIEKASQEEKPEPPAFTHILSSAELLELDLSTDFLVRQILARGQHCVVGGRSKTLKTSIAIDLVVSLGTGIPFLGVYETTRCRACLWTGESGGDAIRNTAKRVAAERGVDLRNADIFWCFDLPKLFSLEHLDYLEKLIVERGLHVIVIDPLYLCLLSPEMAGNASNVFAMGGLLEPIGKIGQRTGCTIILLHHFRKGPGADADEPCSLEQLSQAGVAEWARQWLLLERRRPYQSDGHHELYLRAGGSAGHGSLLALDVDEGVYSQDIPGGGRRWDVAVRPVSDVREEQRQAGDQRKIEQREQRDADDRRKMLESLRRHSAGETLRTLRDEAGLSGARAGHAIGVLVGEGRAEQIDVTKNSRTEQGYRYVER